MQQLVHIPHMGNKMLEGRLMYEGLAKSNFAVLKHMVVSDIILLCFMFCMYYALLVWEDLNVISSQMVYIW